MELAPKSNYTSCLACQGHIALQYTTWYLYLPVYADVRIQPVFDNDVCLENISETLVHLHILNILKYIFTAISMISVK